MPETTAGRGALRVLQAGAVAIVLAAASYKLFELDRYFVPKELALHLTALAAIIACVQGARRLELTRVDTLLAVYLLLGLVSAVLADNHWAAARALGITFSALVLSRSRAAMLAVIAGAAVLAIGVWLAQRRFHDPRIARRLPLAAAFAAAGAAVAILVPNALNWKSDSPYLDTVTGVVNYREGSGHGRLVQYGTSLKLAAEHPLLGVGPGNWAVAYPKVAAKGDPSIDRDDGMTANPWPSSDWVAMIAERGIPATLAFVLALTGLAVLAFGAMRNSLDLEEFL